ncbi:Hypothetical protein UVM_LOCUS491 [uncultured virus]|nr:Hypothetical protein UVM_LOCUS491 [uncultured virus]
MTTSSAWPSLSDLPEELLWQTFLRLTDGARHLCAIMSVCRAWYRIVDNSLWRAAYARGGWLSPGQVACAEQQEENDQDPDFWRAAYRDARISVAWCVANQHLPLSAAVDEAFCARLRALLPHGSRVAAFDVTNSPLPTDLNQFNAVCLASMNTFVYDKAKAGDELANYVDNGGGVVLCGYTLCGCPPTGRWCSYAQSDWRRPSEYSPVACEQSLQVLTGLCIDSASVLSDHALLRGAGRLAFARQSERDYYASYRCGLVWVSNENRRRTRHTA